jgi:hypothetical protein
MPRAKAKVVEVEEGERIVVSGVDVEEILKSEKPKEELPVIDWLTAKNKMVFLDYVALRAKYGLEG